MAKERAKRIMLAKTAIASQQAYENKMLFLAKSEVILYTKSRGKGTTKNEAGCHPVYILGSFLIYFDSVIQ